MELLEQYRRSRYLCFDLAAHVVGEEDRRRLMGDCAYDSHLAAMKMAAQERLAAGQFRPVQDS